MRHLVFLLFLVLPTVFLSADLYEIDVSLDATSGTINATMTVDWSNDTGRVATNIAFLLYPNLFREKNPKLSDLALSQVYPLGFDPGYIHVDSVRGENGERLDFVVEETPAPFGQKYSTKDTLMRVKLSKRVRSGESFKLVMRFSTKFPLITQGDNTRLGGVYIWRFAWYPVEPADEGVFVPKPHRWRLRFNLPKGYRAITAGEASSDGWIDSRVPMTTCPIVLSKIHKTYTLSDGDHVVKIHYLKGSQSRARVLATYALGILRYYEERYGRLDYSTVNIVQDLPSGLFGMAADGLVLLSDGAFTGADLVIPGFIDPALHFLLAHELAHLWFGVGVEVDYSRDNHLSESLAQYAAVEHVESVYGYRHNVLDMEIPDLLVRNLKSRLLLDSWTEQAVYLYDELARDGLDGPAAIGMGKGYLNSHSTLWYQKGLLAMRNLEVGLGKEKLQKALKLYYETNRNRLGGEKAFLEALSKVGGNDAVKLYTKLFKSSKTVDYGVETSGKTVRVESVGNEDVPVEVFVTFTDGSTELSVVTGDATLTFDKDVTEAAVDPHRKSFDHRRLDNHYPRLIVNELDPRMGKIAKWKTSVLDSLHVYPVISTSFDASGNAVALTGVGVEYFDHWKMAFGAQLTVESSGSNVQIERSDYFFSGWYKLNSYLQWSLSAKGGVENGSSPTYSVAGSLSLALPETLDLGYTAPYRGARWNFGISGSFSSFGYGLGGYAVFDNTAFTGSLLAGEVEMKAKDGGTPTYSGGVELFQGWRYGPIGFSLRGAFDAKEAPALLDFDLSKLSDALSIPDRHVRLEGALNLSLQNPTRMKIYNLAALRGTELGLKYGYLRSWDPDHEIHAFGMSLVYQLYTLFESPVPLGLQFIVYSVDGSEPEEAVGIGLGLDDLVHTSYTMW